MKRKFVGGSPPLFGTKTNPKPISYLTRCPWYWWFEYLRRNADYLKTCENRGRGKCAAIYADFGDVRRVGFKSWWTKGDRGGTLFGEPQLSTAVEVVKDLDRVPPDGDVLIVQIPLNVPQKYLKRRISQILKKAHKGQRGAPKLSKSAARYRLHRKCSPMALEKGLKVFDERQRDLQAPLWKIGERVGVIIKGDWRVKATDPPETKVDKKNVTATVTYRYLKRARAAIKNVGSGRFPDYS